MSIFLIVIITSKARFARSVSELVVNSSSSFGVICQENLVYGELHPKARTLSNMDFIQLKNVPIEGRHIAFAGMIDVPVSELKAKSLADAQERFYHKGHNSALLGQYVELLEDLEKGEILNKENTKSILEHMENMKTGDHRLKAGLKEDLVFHQKTGTQLNRACNVGLIREKGMERAALSIAVCIKKPSESFDSDRVFKEIGEKLSSSFRTKHRRKNNGSPETLSRQTD